MKYLVTGGAGFIGSTLVEALLARGDAVRVFDNFSTGNIENLADVRDDVEVIEGDLRDLDALHDAARGCEVIYHQGALASVPRSVADPMPTHIHEGTCDNLTAEPAYGLPNVVDGRSESTVDVSLETLTASDYAINLHMSDDDLTTYTSCGDIEAAE